MMDNLSETEAAQTKVRRAKAPSRGTSSIAKAVSHNLNGQRLGKKGRDTRERIICAAQTLLDRPEPITLSAVAREASLGMTSLYLYFTDLTELLLAVLEPVMATAEEAYIRAMRARWPDDSLNVHCYEFVSAYYAFWNRHSRILHLRNSMADQHDRRMAVHRVSSAQQLIHLLVDQMDYERRSGNMWAMDMATVLLTGIERVITMATDANVRQMVEAQRPHQVPDRLRTVARLLELGIREFRGENSRDPTA